MENSEIRQAAKVNDTIEYSCWICLALFILAPRILGFFFGIGALGCINGSLSVWQNKKRSTLHKVFFYAEWLVCWLLTFGFGCQTKGLITAGLALAIVTSVTELVTNFGKKSLFPKVFWLLCYFFMMTAVLNGSTQIGVDNGIKNGWR